MAEAKMELGSAMPESLREEAKRRFVHRFTREHVPAWAATPAPNGKFCAPQYASDEEWLANTRFALARGGAEFDRRCSHCESGGQTWPDGRWLDEPFRKETAPPRSPKPR